MQKRLRVCGAFEVFLFVAFVKLHVFASARLTDAVVLAVIDPTSVTLRCKYFLAELLGACDCGEVADAYAVERAFEFARIFDFGDVGLDALVGELAYDAVRGSSRWLDAHLDDERTRGALFDAR